MRAAVSARASQRASRRRLTVWLIGMTGAIVALGIIVLLFAVPFMVRREVPQDGLYIVGELRASVDVKIQKGGTYQVELLFADLNGRPAEPQSVSISISMDGHAMQPLGQAVERLGVGAYGARGQLTMPGRWLFAVTTEGGSIETIVNYANSF